MIVAGRRESEIDISWQKSPGSRSVRTNKCSHKYLRKSFPAINRSKNRKIRLLHFRERERKLTTSGIHQRGTDEKAPVQNSIKLITEREREWAIFFILSYELLILTALIHPRTHAHTHSIAHTPRPHAHRHIYARTIKDTIYYLQCLK